MYIFKINPINNIQYYYILDSKDNNYRLIDKVPDTYVGVVVEKTSEESDIIYIESLIYSNVLIFLDKMTSELLLEKDYDKLDIFFKFNYNSVDNVVFTFIIQHDDFVISNSKGIKHKIRGLQSTLSFNYVRKKSGLEEIVTFRQGGRRISKNYIEKRYQYSHSHLRSTDYFNIFESYCTGNTEMKNACNGVYRNINSIDFIYIVNVMELFVKWESLEGGPHVRIQTLYDQFSENDYDDYSNLNVLNTLKISKISVSKSNDNIYYKFEIQDQNNLTNIENVDVVYAGYGVIKRSTVINYKKNKSYTCDKLYDFKWNKNIPIIILAIDNEDINNIMGSYSSIRDINSDDVLKLNKLIHDNFKYSQKTISRLSVS